MTGSFWLDDANAPSTSTSQPRFPHAVPGNTSRRHSVSNVFQLLARREVSPRNKHSSKRLWGETSKLNADSFRPTSKADIDARLGLISWVEAESLRHLSARYCPLMPPPRSTIAAAFSPDGKTLASTHGDHTVKIIDCQTGNCLKVLSGHRRTPWVVRFHPLHPEIIASGSLDYEVRLWDANTAECIGSRDFYRPIASIAFHAQGEILAVASGHKLYIWHYNRRCEASSPTIILKTRRSLRAVHFHPYAAPFLLTAEVNDLDSPDSSMTLATSAGYLRYPPPAVFLANVHSSDRPNMAAELPFMPLPFMFLPSFARDDGRTSLSHANRVVGSSAAQQLEESSSSVQIQPDSNVGSHYDYLVSPMEMSPLVPPTSYPVPEETNSVSNEIEHGVSDSAMDTMDTSEVQPVEENQQQSSGGANSVPSLFLPSNGVAGQTSSRQDRLGFEIGQLHQLFPFGDSTCWELPFLQGWLMGQSQANLHSMLPFAGGTNENSSGVQVMGSDIFSSDIAIRNVEAPVASSVMPINVSQSRVSGRSGSRHRLSRSRSMAPTGSGEVAAFINLTHDESDPQLVASRIQTELATSLAAVAAAELPCTVKLRIWPHDIKDPCAHLDAERCRLTIPHAVLCSEMGAHFSPCGRFLAACVACMLPHMESDPGLQTHVQLDVTGAATSPTRHPISAHQVMYELRIYSLEEATFGSVLASRAIRAAHCLTSIQFSPTSEHILLAYGRRHSSLLKSIVIDGETTVPIYTILEVYRVSDMELVRVLPSAEDEVNVACFHPSVGGGLVYGTKEGKLRILQYDGSQGSYCTGSNFFLEENMVEVQTYALEG